MLSNKKWLVVVALLALMAIVLGACAPATPATTEAPPSTTEVAPTTTETATEVAAPTGKFLPATDMVACKDLPPLPAAAVKSQNVAAAVPSVARARTIKATEANLASPPQQGKIYKVGIFSDMTTNNFWRANGPDNTVWNSYINFTPTRLTMYALSDVTFQFIPWVAKALPDPLVEEGGMWVTTIPIREDIKWSDGTPFTAKDVAFTANTTLKFELIAGNWSAWYRGDYLDHVEAVDDFTVKYFYHTKPGLAVHEYGALQAPILQEAFWAPKLGDDGAGAALKGLTRPGKDASEADKTAYTTAATTATEALYNLDPSGEPLAGAFIFDKWETGAFASSNANPNFLTGGATVTEYANGAYHESKANVYDFTLYGEATGDKTLEYKVGPNVATAVYTIYADQNTAVLALKNGEIDFMLNPLGLQRGLLSEVEGDPNLKVIRNNTNGMRYMTFNVRRRPMNDCSFRQMVAVLIDKEFVTNTILQKVAFPLYTFVPAANKAWYLDSEDVKKLGQGMNREARINYAIAIAEAAGYTWEGGVKPAWNADNASVDVGGRLIMPDGTPVPEISLIAPTYGYDPLRATFAIWIETWMNEFGIPVKANLQGFNTMVDLMFTKQDFDFAILGWSLSVFPTYMRDFWHSDQAVPDGNNAGGYHDADFDKMSEELNTCDSFEACKKIVDTLQVKLSTETPYVVLFETGIIEAYSANVEYPYTDTLSGLQFLAGLPSSVSVAK
jgi:ABC-type transport system substrate-binding protein